MSTPNSFRNPVRVLNPDRVDVIALDKSFIFRYIELGFLFGGPGL